MSGSESTVRSAAVAGVFYPATPGALAAAVQRSFTAAADPRSGARVPKALVVPHAAYRYSGPIAASAYLRLVPARSTIRRVVLIGPSHRVPVHGIGVSSADALETPLGQIRVDSELRDVVLGRPAVNIDDAAHAFEHSLEVQLPFLQTVLDDFTVLPLSVGDVADGEVADVLEACWGGSDTLVVVSTDLSHYHPYAAARDLDARTAAAITALRPDEISDTGACGARALRGLLAVVRAHHLMIEAIDVRNSGDTAGDRDRVVGYGAFTVA